MAHQHAIVIRRRDDDRVDIFAIEDLAIVRIDVPLRIALCHSSLAAGESTVGGRNQLSWLGQLVDQQVAPVADTYDPDLDAVVGAEDLLGNDHRECSGADCA